MKTFCFILAIIYLLTGLFQITSMERSVLLINRILPQFVLMQSSLNIPHKIYQGLILSSTCVSIPY